MTIGKKLISSFGAVAAAASINSFMALSGSATIAALLKSTVESDAKALEIVGGMKNSVTKMRFAQRGVVLYSMSGDTALADTNRKDFLTSRNAVSQALDQLTSIQHDPAVTDAVAGMRKIVAGYDDSFTKVSSFAEQKQFSEAITALKAAGALGKEMDKNSDAVAAVVRKLMEQSADVAAGSASAARALALALMLTCCAVGAVVLMIVTGVNRRLRHIASELSDGSRQIAQAAAQVSSSGQSLARSASEEASAVQRVTESANKMAATGQKNAQEAEAARCLVGKASEIECHVLAAVEATAESIRSMHQSANEIEKILKVIEEIAFQTNILALNAAVEAARAGDAGLGFAVVADEVRNLAQRSAAAAKESGDRVMRSSANAQDGLERVARLKSAVGSSEEIRKSLGSFALGIAASSRNQGAAIADLSAILRQMDDAIETTAASAEESATAVEQMSSQAQAFDGLAARLQEMVGAR